MSKGIDVATSEERMLVSNRPAFSATGPEEAVIVHLAVQRIVVRVTKELIKYLVLEELLVVD